MGFHFPDERFTETQRSGSNGREELVSHTRFPQTDRTRCNGCENGCSTAYGYGSATVTHLDRAVRGNLNHYLQDEEARSKILQLGKSIVTYAIIEGLKTIPGGFVGYNIVNKSIKDLKDSDKQEVDVKALHADVRRLEKELSEYRKLHPIDKPSADLKSPNTVNIHSAVYQKPEDVIRVFMMNEFMGRKFLDDLMVPSVAPRKK